MARLGVYVADGFADDCEELIHRCSKKKPLTYHTFCTIWKSMNFATFYQGRTTSAEIAELSEEVILVAKRYMLANTNNFEETVAGLFLIYALINLQPFPNFAALRITPDDVPMIRYIEDTARKEKRYDALYILGAVMIKGPCQFHAAEREYGMEIAFRKNFEGIDDSFNSRLKGVFSRRNEELEILEELKTLTQRYEETKAAVTNETGDVDRNLKYVDPKFAEEMESSLKKVIMGLTDSVDDEDKLKNQDSADRHESVQAIKRRALKNTVNSMGHLTGVKERAVPSCSAQSRNLPKKGGKIKTSSPKKPLATRPRQQKHTRPKKKVKRRKNEISSSESEGDDLLALPDSDGDDISEANSESESQADIDETRFDKDSKERRNVNYLNETDTTEDDEAIAQLEEEINIEIDTLPVLIRKSKNQNIEIDTTKDDEAIGQLEKEINIEIDTLPVLIRKSTNQNIEIEFIDNYKKDESKPSTSKAKSEATKDLRSKLAELDDDVSVVKNPPEPESSGMDFIFKRPGPGRCYTSKAKFKLISKKSSKQVKSTLKNMGFKEMPNIDDVKKS